MLHGFYNWIKRVVSDISSLPTLLILLFIAGAFFQLATTRLEISLPPLLDRFDLHDVDTIRTLLAAVIGGVFTLIIFTYTMVMNVIDRSVSTYSPRLLPLLTHERYHQITLGISLGTVAHAIILLLGTTEETVLRTHPPLFAAASSGLFAVITLFLFIYFIHHVTQSIHVNKVLRKSFEQTQRLIKELEDSPTQLSQTDPTQINQPKSQALHAKTCGYLQGLQLDRLTALAAKYATPIHVCKAHGSFIYAGEAIAKFDAESRADELCADLNRTLEVSAEEPVQVHETGFKHLVEVAAKACSPALNDPATALTAVHYLTQLFLDYQSHTPFNTAINAAGGTVYLTHFSYEELRANCFTELRAYLGDDPWTARAVEEAWRQTDGSR